MTLVKCPRCELNYMNEGEKMCSVCRKELRGDTEQYDVIELCSECGENPAVPGRIGRGAWPDVRLPMRPGAEGAPAPSAPGKSQTVIAGISLSPRSGAGWQWPRPSWR